MADAVDMRKITVRFDKVVANQEVDFQARWGEVHGLVGENGAGKTTLMRVLYGMYTHHEGEMYIDGVKTRFASPKDAIAKGIGMVHQHFSLVPSMTVAENVVIGKPPYKKGLIDLVRSQEIVQELSETYGLEINPRAVSYTHLNIVKKFDAFGFECFEVDGHDMDAIVTALKAPVSGKPKFICCNTVKGKGVSFMEDQFGWHGSPMNKEQFEKALSEQEVE